MRKTLLYIGLAILALSQIYSIYRGNEPLLHVLVLVIVVLVFGYRIYIERDQQKNKL